jgi:hypothetical protein
MNILNELQLMSETKGKNLIGLTIGGKKITEKTPSEPWAGNFRCSDHHLTSLVGAPSSVGGYFSCSYNKLTSLVGAPSSVDGYFNCSTNKLTSLEGAPSSVGSHFNCSNNNLTSLVGAPSSVGDSFYCAYNNLTSLEGSPSSVGGDFVCSRNQLTSLTGIEKILKKMNGIFYAEGNPLESHVIGLLLVPGCNKVMLGNKQVQEILNRHLKSPFGKRRFFDCQSELLDSGLDDFAKL